MSDEINQIVVNVTLFERLEPKGKFNKVSAVFDDNEPVGEIMAWAYGKSAEMKQEIVKIELHKDGR